MVKTKDLGLKKILTLYFLKVFNFGFLYLKNKKKNKNCHSKTCVRDNIWYYQNPMDIFFSHLHLNPTVRCFVTWMFFYDDLQSFELATISTRS